MGYLLKKWRRIFLGTLVFGNILVWQSVSGALPSTGILTVAFLNIGQGDSIYIESPTGTQVIFDGGPDSSILRELGSVMPFSDRSLDMLVVTNPDKDHYAGFLDVLERYSVDAVLQPGTVSTTYEYKFLEKKIGEKNIPRIVGKGGQVYDLGGGALLYVLFPDLDITNWESNGGSLIAKLVYGKTSVLLTGDTTVNIEKYIASENGGALGESWSGGESILKVAHHGSRTSTAPELVAALRPIAAVISAGAGNSYGHPHKETLTTLEKAGVPALVTAKEGRIVFESDGEHFIRR